MGGIRISPQLEALITPAMLPRTPLQHMLLMAIKEVRPGGRLTLHPAAEPLVLCATGAACCWLLFFFGECCSSFLAICCQHVLCMQSPHVLCASAKRRRSARQEVEGLPYAGLPDAPGLLALAPSKGSSHTHDAALPSCVPKPRVQATAPSGQPAIFVIPLLTSCTDLTPHALCRAPAAAAAATA